MWGPSANKGRCLVHLTGALSRAPGCATLNLWAVPADGRHLHRACDTYQGVVSGIADTEEEVAQSIPQYPVKKSFPDSDKQQEGHRNRS
mmetsp:Transcript_145040/g.267410  ORF Transcript_145040/g.267410 Transcript_145040/m.267410 type:complete len:89 (+) Transcript_145040:1-267(+)